MTHSGLAGARILVVGASAGIGRATALAAVRAGADVVLTARREDALTAAIAEGGGGHVVAGDIRDPDDCTRIATESAEALGALDLLVVAAAMSPLRPLREMTTADWDAVFRTNVFGVSQVIAACLPHLAPTAIVAILSSEMAFRPRHGLVPYAASKAALETVVNGWRLEHPDLRFATVVVGPTLGTEFGDGFDPDAIAAAFPSWFAHGEIRTGMMDKDELATLLLATLASALERPGIELQSLTLRPPGPLAESIDEIVRLQAEQAARGAAD